MSKTRAELARMMPDAFPIFFGGRQPYEGQARAMPEIVRGNNVLFAAPTASGKTEAAVAPLLQRHLSFKRQSLSTVYIAPTKALVNDLYERLVAYLGARLPNRITRYTGDHHELTSSSEAFCLLVTPEALDSLQLRSPETLAAVRAIVVDEIHLLHGQPRGQQLRHVIDRISQARRPAHSSRDGFQVVGMTATLDDMEEVSRIWLGAAASIISQGTPREIDFSFIPALEGGQVDPLLPRAKALAKWLEAFSINKALVFANSRNAAHTLATYLNRELAGKRWPVHLHFAALSASVRERIEEEMRRHPYGVCVATSTLEIGIDIGDIDVVVLAAPPASVSAFLQRIGRGNRRSGTCRVAAFKDSDEQDRIYHALIDSAKRGELDDVNEYDRPSVRFQQVLSLCWRATRNNRALSISGIGSEAGTNLHAVTIMDMLDSGTLINHLGALIPCDRLMDDADAGRIHSVIVGQPGASIIDQRTGDDALRGLDVDSSGGVMFVGGSERRLVIGTDGKGFLTDCASDSHPLVRIASIGNGVVTSRAIIWGVARQLGYDPTRWRSEGTNLVTWGGRNFNLLIAALFERHAPGKKFIAADEAVSGPLSALEITVANIREWANQAEAKGDLPLTIARQFTDRSRFLGELSSRLVAQEQRDSVPWRTFRRWLDNVTAIDQVGAT